MFVRREDDRKNRDSASFLLSNPFNSSHRRLLWLRHSNRSLQIHVPETDEETCNYDVTPSFLVGLERGARDKTHRKKFLIYVLG